MIDRSDYSMDPANHILELLSVVPETPAWKRQANCRESSIDFFSFVKEEQDEAKKLCAACDVRTQCYNFAVTNKEFGLWGGVWHGSRWRHGTRTAEAKRT